MLAANALTTADQLVDVLGEDPGEIVERLINVASMRIERVTRRKLYQAEVTEAFDPKLKRLIVSRPPVTSVVTEDIELEDADAGLLLVNGHIMLEGDKREVTYVGGFVTPQQAVDDPELTVTLPADLEQACVELARWLYTVRNADTTITSERVGDIAYTYAHPGLPDHVQDMIVSYRL